MVARQRFPFPDAENPNLRTYKNEPERTMGVGSGPDAVYPDIVVVDTMKNVVAMIGEIETEMTINADETLQWRKYSSLGATFYLYVPVDSRWDAQNLLTSNGIKLAGLRMYSYDSLGNLSISNV